MNSKVESIREVEFENIEKPNPIYKYRSWANQYNRTVITELSVYLAPPTSFEDKLDCKNPVRYDLLTDEQIRSYFYNESLEQNSHFSQQQHIQFANEWFEKTGIRHKDFTDKQQEKDFLEWDQRIGILSLTGDPTRIEMWEKYSDSHKGFCVGFDSEVMFKFMGGGGKVMYVETLPVVMPSIIDDYMVQVHKQVYHKLKKWEFEDEYRIQLFNINGHTSKSRVVKLPPEAFKEIILGDKMPDGDKKEIKTVAEKLLPHIKFRQAQISGGKIIIK